MIWRRGVVDKVVVGGIVIAVGAPEAEGVRSRFGYIRFIVVAANRTSPAREMTTGMSAASAVPTASTSRVAPGTPEHRSRQQGNNHNWFHNRIPQKTAGIPNI